MIPILKDFRLGARTRDCLNPRITDDPRLTASQLDALAAVAERDGRAQVAGLDARLRPVVAASLPGPQGRTRYALLRNGDPAPERKPMAEVWR